MGPLLGEYNVGICLKFEHTVMPVQKGLRDDVSLE